MTRSPNAARPDYDQLFDVAAAQEGLFTTQQADEAGYSPQLLVHYVRTGKAVRLRRGIYRLVHFPPGEHEDLVVAWLWSEQAGVISHETALRLHGLSDILPSKIHLTLPSAWSRRRFRVPKGVVLHHADVPAKDRTWFGPVPVTNPARTINDCARAALSPEHLRTAARQGLMRGLFSPRQIRDVKEALEEYGGLPA